MGKGVEKVILKQSTIEKKYISIKGIAAMTRQSVSTVRRQIKSSKVPLYRLSTGGPNVGIRILESDLEQFLLARRRLPDFRIAAPRESGLKTKNGIR